MSGVKSHRPTVVDSEGHVLIVIINVMRLHWLIISVGCWNVSLEKTPLGNLMVNARCSSVVRVFAHGAMVRWVVRSILHGVDPLSYFSFQPVFHDWCNKGHGMCYPVCGMVHIKEPLPLIGKSSPCGGSGFPLSLSEWYFTICLMPYNRK